MSAQQFESWTDFILGDVRRYTSMGGDYGLYWQDGHQSWPRWRVSSLYATGEVYAIAQRYPAGPVWLLGTVTGIDDQDRDAQIDHALRGWADPEVSGFDLAWVVVRLRQHAAMMGSLPPGDDDPRTREWPRCRHCGKPIRLITQHALDHREWVDVDGFGACVKAGPLHRVAGGAVEPEWPFVLHEPLPEQLTGREADGTAAG